MKNVSFIFVTSMFLIGTYSQLSFAQGKPTIVWAAGAQMGIIENGKGIGIISGTGKLDYHVSGAYISGDVKAVGNGECIYSNVSNGTTTGEYWDGARAWEAGAVIGIIEKGKNIGILNGKGKLDFTASGAHVTGDVKADKGVYTYSNVITGTTTDEYWDGVKMWRAGAVLGVKSNSNEIVVIKGDLK